MSEKLRTMLLVVAVLLLALTLAGCGRKASGPLYPHVLLPSPGGQFLAVGATNGEPGASQNQASWLGILNSKTWSIEWHTSNSKPFLVPTDWSADGARLLFFRSSFSSSRIGTFTVSLPLGREERALPAIVLGSGFLWSPDGKWLCYVGTSTGDLRTEALHQKTLPRFLPLAKNEATGQVVALPVEADFYELKAVTPSVDGRGSKAFLLRFHAEPKGLTFGLDKVSCWSVELGASSGKQLFPIPHADRRVAVSPSGKLIACGVDGGKIAKSRLELHSGETGELLNQVEIPGRIEWLSFSPDEKTVLCSSPAGAWLWMPSGKDSAVLPLSELLAKTEDSATKVRLSALCWLGDSQHVVAARGTRLWLLDLKANTATQVADLAKH